VGGKVLGVVLNGVRGELSADYSTYKMNRYYAYSYGKDEKLRKGAMGNFIDSTEKQARNILGVIVKKAKELLNKRAK